MQKAGTLWYHLTYIYRIYLLYFCVLYKEWRFKCGAVFAYQVDGCGRTGNNDKR